MSFVEFAKSWRERHGLTHVQAAEALCIPVETWRAWMYGKNKCGFEASFIKLMTLLEERWK